MYYNLLVVLSLIGLSCCVNQNSYENEDLFSEENKGLWYIEGQHKNTHDGFWELKDGVLTCNTRGNTSHPGSWYVFKSPIDDFEFKVDFRYDKNLKGNSGIQFRIKSEAELLTIPLHRVRSLTSRMGELIYPKHIRQKQ